MAGECFMNVTGEFAGRPSGFTRTSGFLGRVA